MKRKSKIALAAMALILSAVVSAGATFAYFTDYEEARGMKELTLGHETEITEGNSESDKHIVIKNTGETEAVARVAVIGNDRFMTITSDKEGDWIKKGDYWYYTRVIKPGDESSELYVKVEAPDSEKDVNFDIVVAHESKQAVYDGDTPVSPDGWDSIEYAGEGE